jgi:hypothetical protein
MPFVDIYAESLTSFTRRASRIPTARPLQCLLRAARVPASRQAYEDRRSSISDGRNAGIKCRALISGQ